MEGEVNLPPGGGHCYNPEGCAVSLCKEAGLPEARRLVKSHGEHVGQAERGPELASSRRSTLLCPSERSSDEGHSVRLACGRHKRADLVF